MRRRTRNASSGDVVKRARYRVTANGGTRKADATANRLFSRAHDFATGCRSARFGSISRGFSNTDPGIRSSIARGPFKIFLSPGYRVSPSAKRISLRNISSVTFAPPFPINDSERNAPSPSQRATTSSASAVTDFPWFISISFYVFITRRPCFYIFN